jgi:hypothetical protein
MEYVQPRSERYGFNKRATNWLPTKRIVPHMRGHNAVHPDAVTPFCPSNTVPVSVFGLSTKIIWGAAGTAGSIFNTGVLAPGGNCAKIFLDRLLNLGLVFGARHRRNYVSLSEQY